ncbi:membrane protein, putative [Desulfocucumis palustris]|uniref:Membrane protein, putative n=1 Tax=Desulfocucumis palustris TaxID=1898651 RepID=A0A2L2X6R9_9FIRM|nr:permease [Desulfocucumis palustris]GBF31845.1 membrane protein, putative [Desulfocucumis palustris]
MIKLIGQAVAAAGERNELRIIIKSSTKIIYIAFALSCLYLMWHLLKLAELKGLSEYIKQSVSSAGILNFKTVFLSIIIEALPFIIIGVFVSAIIQNFVSEETIGRVLPKSRLFSILIASLLGIIFPVCECGIVPVARRLVQKGVPLYSAITFMLAAPVINPVVASSTAIAFTVRPDIVWFRLGFSFIVACLTGLILSFLFHGRELKAGADMHGHGCGCGCSHHQEYSPGTFSGKIRGTFQDACDEFFEMGKYLMLGAFLAATAQSFISQDLLTGIGKESFSSILTMMSFAFGLSVCSSADAFIAASFINLFSSGSLLAFMVFGPMIDLKNILMLLNAFKLRFVVILTVIVTLLIICGAYMINLWQ